MTGTAADPVGQPEPNPTQPRQSTRVPTRKRFRYEPGAMGHDPTDSSAFHMDANGIAFPQHLIVDTGASHVLFRHEDSSHLSNVQMSSPGDCPFAILKAANGALLDSIGRGMLTIQTVTVIASLPLPTADARLSLMPNSFACTTSTSNQS
jgi:hypothetical protein